MGVECVSRTHVGLRRKINEDSFLASTEQRLWVVADGMGGHEAGDVASAMVVDSLAKLSPVDSLQDQVKAAIAELVAVNGRLIELARHSDHPRTIGSTVVGIAIGEGEFRCFWAGDSRAYRVRGDTILQLSRDHSLVQGLIDAKMLDPRDAATHPNASVITRAVGADATLEVETVRGLVRPGDRFLLASDGLTRVVPDDELLDTLTTLPPDQAADALIDLVLSRGAPDNVTLIVTSVT